MLSCRFSSGAALSASASASAPASRMLMSLWLRNAEFWIAGEKEEATLVVSCWRLRKWRRRPRWRVLPFAKGDDWMEGEKEEATLVVSGFEEDGSELELELGLPKALGSYLGVRIVSGKGEEV